MFRWRKKYYELAKINKKIIKNYQLKEQQLEFELSRLEKKIKSQDRLIKKLQNKQHQNNKKGG